MTEFYYSKLIRDGLIHCDVFMHEGRVAGFCAYTDFPFSFMAEGIRRHRLSLTAILSVSIAADPSRLAVLFGARTLSHKRKLRKDSREKGECLSLGVVPEFANIRDPQSGIRISHALFRKALDHFIQARFKEILLVIEKSNRHAFAFYEGYGALPQESDYVADHCRLMSVAL